MAVSAIRTVIIYGFIIFAMRLMGKRQLGELQPTELVVTMMISDLAAVPMQDDAVPLVRGLIPIVLLVGTELILSAASLKSPLVNRLLSGNPVTVIRDGVVDPRAMKKLRVGVDDLVAMLHAQQIFDPASVQYAVMEAGGRLTCFLKPSERPATCRDVGAQPDDGGMPVLIISDGYLHKNNLALCDADEAWVDGVLAARGVARRDVLVMTADRAHMVRLFGQDGGML